MSKVTHYVCGLLFSESRDCVVLIRKNRPAWQAGKLNGVGGKVEPGENPRQAIEREFREEAGVSISTWSYFARLSGVDFQVWFYTASSDDAYRAKEQTDERIEHQPPWNINALFAQGETVENLPWLVPLALEHLRYGAQLFSHVRYGGTDQAKDGEDNSREGHMDRAQPGMQLFTPRKKEGAE
jgi:8-oxo-dGTP diphosphatase